MLKDPKTGGNLILLHGEKEIETFFYKRDHDNKYFTIAWNIGKKQSVLIDDVSHPLLPHTILPIMFNQTFQFSQAQDIVAWQFNREFYCIVDHDAEVSCVGFLFGLGDNMFITLDKEDQQKVSLLFNIFIAEMNTPDHIQNDMLLMLLKRLIITITRLAKSNYVADEKLTDDRFNVVRKFNLLVEANFRSHHSVSYYAQLLNKSPKTLSNLFSLYNDKTPLQIIQERILIEAKRLLYYTDKSVKEITYELGFDDSAYFSAFFKRHTSQSPSDFRMPKGKMHHGK